MKGYFFHGLIMGWKIQRGFILVYPDSISLLFWKSGMIQ